MDSRDGELHTNDAVDSLDARRGEGLTLAAI
jgi:hypothetical protein